jgi:hypothetical protein
MSPKPDVAKIRSDREPVPSYDAWVSAMVVEASLTDEAEFDPSTILNSIMEAESFEDALARQNATLLSGKGIVGRQHRINGFTLRPSDEKYATSDKALGVYAVVDAIDLDSGESFTYGVGAANVLAILWQARKFGHVPGDFVLNSRATRNGDLLSLNRVGKRTVQVS